MIKTKFSKKGLTLLELMISLSFISIIFILSSNIIFLSYNAKNDTEVYSGTYLDYKIFENNLINDFQNAASIIIKKDDSTTVLDGYKKYSYTNNILTVTSDSEPTRSFENITALNFKVVNTGNKIILKYTLSAGEGEEMIIQDSGLVINNNSTSTFKQENADIEFNTKSYNLKDADNSDNNYVIFVR